ncbi:MAG: type IV pilus assembly protein FimV [Thermodesulfobacteriota bacterium]
MHLTTGILRRYGTWVIALAVLALFLSPVGAAFFEKQYLVRELDGRDVLCDPYVVQSNDYVTKLLKQRGDIASKDFPRFLKIFKALNPDVDDVDTIYPNQRILIPLKILAPESVAGQKSGTVTIPVITITNMPQTLRQHSVEYEVQYGDWVAKLISERFGRPGTDSYQRGLALFKKLNPDIDDIDFIRSGDSIRLPEPSIQNTAAYSAMFDESGQIVDFDKARTAAGSQKPPAVPEASRSEPEPAAKEPSQPAPKAEKARDRPAQSRSDAAQPDEADKDSDAAEADKDEPAQAEVEVPRTLKGFSDQSVFVKAAKILDAELLNEGEYFFPRDAQSDLRLVLDKTPMMVFEGGIRLLFANRNWLDPADRKVIESHWPGIRIVFVESNMMLEPLMENIIPLIDSDGYENRVELSDEGVRMTVRGQFIYEPPAGGDRVCLNIIEEPEMWVPAPIRAYLEGKGIIVRDWIEGENVSGWARAVHAETVESPDVDVIDANPPARVIARLAESLGYTYQADVEITFPYAGFQVRAKTNMLSTGPGREVLIDYGDLGGDAVKSIEKNGFRVAQIKNPIGGKALIDKLAPLLPARFTSDPVFWSAQRPRLYNPSYEVSGVLIAGNQEGVEKKILVAFSPVPVPIAAHLEGTGVELMRLRQ